MTEDPSSLKFYRVAPVKDFPQGERLFLNIDGHAIILFSVGQEFLATGNLCTHDGGDLGDGELVGQEVVCPRHGARFNIRTGKVMSFPAVVDIPIYPVRVVDDFLEIGIPI